MQNASNLSVSGQSQVNHVSNTSDAVRTAGDGVNRLRSANNSASSTTSQSLRSKVGNKKQKQTSSHIPSLLKLDLLHRLYYNGRQASNDYMVGITTTSSSSAAGRPSSSSTLGSMPPQNTTNDAALETNKRILDSLYERWNRAKRLRERRRRIQRDDEHHQHHREGRRAKLSIKRKQQRGLGGVEEHVIEEDEEDEEEESDDSDDDLYDDDYDYDEDEEKFNMNTCSGSSKVRSQSTNGMLARGRKMKSETKDLLLRARPSSTASISYGKRKGAASETNALKSTVSSTRTTQTKSAPTNNNNDNNSVDGNVATANNVDNVHNENDDNNKAIAAAAPRRGGVGAGRRKTGGIGIFDLAMIATRKVEDINEIFSNVAGGIGGGGGGLSQLLLRPPRKGKGERRRKINTVLAAAVGGRGTETKTKDENMGSGGDDEDGHDGVTSLSASSSSLSEDSIKNSGEDDGGEQQRQEGGLYSTTNNNNNNNNNTQSRTTASQREQTERERSFRSAVDSRWAAAVQKSPLQRLSPADVEELRIAWLLMAALKKVNAAWRAEIRRRVEPMGLFERAQRHQEPQQDNGSNNIAAPSNMNRSHEGQHLLHEKVRGDEESVEQEAKERSKNNNDDNNAPVEDKVNTSFHSDRPQQDDGQHSNDDVGNMPSNKLPSAFSYRDGEGLVNATITIDFSNRINDTTNTTRSTSDGKKRGRSPPRCATAEKPASSVTSTFVVSSSQVRTPAEANLNVHKKEEKKKSSPVVRSPLTASISSRPTSPAAPPQRQRQGLVVSSPSPAVATTVAQRSEVPAKILLEIFAKHNYYQALSVVTSSSKAHNNAPHESKKTSKAATTPRRAESPTTSGQTGDKNVNTTNSASYVTAAPSLLHYETPTDAAADAFIPNTPLNRQLYLGIAPSAQQSVLQREVDADGDGESTSSFLVLPPTIPKFVLEDLPALNTDLTQPEFAKLLKKYLIQSGTFDEHGMKLSLYQLLVQIFKEEDGVEGHNRSRDQEEKMREKRHFSPKASEKENRKEECVTSRESAGDENKKDTPASYAWRPSSQQQRTAATLKQTQEGTATDDVEQLKSGVARGSELASFLLALFNSVDTARRSAVSWDQFLTHVLAEVYGIEADSRRGFGSGGGGLTLSTKMLRDEIAMAGGIRGLISAENKASSISSALGGEKEENSHLDEEESKAARYRALAVANTKSTAAAALERLKKIASKIDSFPPTAIAAEFMRRKREVKRLKREETKRRAGGGGVGGSSSAGGISSRGGIFGGGDDSGGKDGGGSGAISTDLFAIVEKKGYTLSYPAFSIHNVSILKAFPQWGAVVAVDGKTAAVFSYADVDAWGKLSGGAESSATADEGHDWKAAAVAQSPEKSNNANNKPTKNTSKESGMNRRQISSALRSGTPSSSSRTTANSPFRASRGGGNNNSNTNKSAYAQRDDDVVGGAKYIQFESIITDVECLFRDRLLVFAVGEREQIHVFQIGSAGAALGSESNVEGSQAASSPSAAFGGEGNVSNLRFICKFELPLFSLETHERIEKDDQMREIKAKVDAARVQQALNRRDLSSPSVNKNDRGAGGGGVTTTTKEENERSRVSETTTIFVTAGGADKGTRAIDAGKPPNSPTPPINVTSTGANAHSRTAAAATAPTMVMSGLTTVTCICAWRDSTNSFANVRKGNTSGASATLLLGGTREGIFFGLSVLDTDEIRRTNGSTTVLFQYRLHKAPISDMCVLPKSGRVVTCSLDGKLISHIPNGVGKNGGGGGATNRRQEGQQLAKSGGVAIGDLTHVDSYLNDSNSTPFQNDSKRRGSSPSSASGSRPASRTASASSRRASSARPPLLAGPSLAAQGHSSLPPPPPPPPHSFSSLAPPWKRTLIEYIGGHTRSITTLVYSGDFEATASSLNRRGRGEGDDENSINNNNEAANNDIRRPTSDGADLAAVGGGAGEVFVSGGLEFKVFVWTDTMSRPLLVFTDNAAPIKSPVVQLLTVPKTPLVYIIDASGLIKLFDVRNGRPLGTWATGGASLANTKGSKKAVGGGGSLAFESSDEEASDAENDEEGDGGGGGGASQALTFLQQQQIAREKKKRKNMPGGDTMALLQDARKRAGFGGKGGKSSKIGIGGGLSIGSSNSSGGSGTLVLTACYTGPSHRTILFGSQTISKFHTEIRTDYANRASHEPVLAIGISRSAIITITTNTLRTWSAHSGKVMATYSTDTYSVSPTVAAAVDSVGAVVFLGKENGFLEAFDVSDGQMLRRYCYHTSPIAGIQLDLDCGLVVSAGRGGDVCVWRNYDARTHGAYVGAADPNVLTAKRIRYGVETPTDDGDDQFHSMQEHTGGNSRNKNNSKFNQEDAESDDKEGSLNTLNVLRRRTSAMTGSNRNLLSLAASSSMNNQISENNAGEMSFRSNGNRRVVDFIENSPWLGLGNDGISSTSATLFPMDEQKRKFDLLPQPANINTNPKSPTMSPAFFQQRQRMLLTTVSGRAVGSTAKGGLLGKESDNKNRVLFASPSSSSPSSSSSFTALLASIAPPVAGTTDPEILTTRIGAREQMYRTQLCNEARLAWWTYHRWCRLVYKRTLARRQDPNSAHHHPSGTHRIVSYPLQVVQCGTVEEAAGRGGAHYPIVGLALEPILMRVGVLLAFNTAMIFDYGWCGAQEHFATEGEEEVTIDSDNDLHQKDTRGEAEAQDDLVVARRPSKSVKATFVKSRLPRKTSIINRTSSSPSHNPIFSPSSSPNSSKRRSAQTIVTVITHRIVENDNSGKKKSDNNKDSSKRSTNNNNGEASASSSALLGLASICFAGNMVFTSDVQGMVYAWLLRSTFSVSSAPQTSGPHSSFLSKATGNADADRQDGSFLLGGSSGAPQLRRDQHSFVIRSANDFAGVSLQSFGILGYTPIKLNTPLLPPPRPIIPIHHSNPAVYEKRFEDGEAFAVNSLQNAFETSAMLLSAWKAHKSQTALAKERQKRRTKRRREALESAKRHLLMTMSESNPTGHFGDRRQTEEKEGNSNFAAVSAKYDEMIAAWKKRKKQQSSNVDHDSTALITGVDPYNHNDVVPLDSSSSLKGEKKDKNLLRDRGGGEGEGGGGAGGTSANRKNGLSELLGNSDSEDSYDECDLTDPRALADEDDSLHHLNTTNIRENKSEQERQQVDFSNMASSASNNNACSQLTMRGGRRVELTSRGSYRADAFLPSPHTVTNDGGYMAGSLDNDRSGNKITNPMLVSRTKNELDGSVNNSNTDTTGGLFSQAHNSPRNTEIVNTVDHHQNNNNNNDNLSDMLSSIMPHVTSLYFDRTRATLISGDDTGEVHLWEIDPIFSDICTNPRHSTLLKVSRVSDVNSNISAIGGNTLLMNNTGRGIDKNNNRGGRRIIRARPTGVAPRHVFGWRTSPNGSHIVIASTIPTTTSWNFCGMMTVSGDSSVRFWNMGGDEVATLRQGPVVDRMWDIPNNWLLEKVGLIRCRWLKFINGVHTAYLSALMKAKQEEAKREAQERSERLVRISAEAFYLKRQRDEAAKMLGMTKEADFKLNALSSPFSNRRRSPMKNSQGGIGAGAHVLVDESSPRGESSSPSGAVVEGLRSKIAFGASSAKAGGPLTTNATAVAATLNSVAESLISPRPSARPAKNGREIDQAVGDKEKELNETIARRNLFTANAMRVDSGAGRVDPDLLECIILGHWLSHSEATNLRNFRVSVAKARQRAEKEAMAGALSRRTASFSVGRSSSSFSLNMLASPNMRQSAVVVSTGESDQTQPPPPSLRSSPPPAGKRKVESCGNHTATAPSPTGHFSSSTSLSRSSSLIIPVAVGKDETSSTSIIMSINAIQQEKRKEGPHQNQNEDVCDADASFLSIKKVRVDSDDDEDPRHHAHLGATGKNIKSAEGGNPLVLSTAANDNNDTKGGENSSSATRRRSTTTDASSNTANPILQNAFQTAHLRRIALSNGFNSAGAASLSPPPSTTSRVGGNDENKNMSGNTYASSPLAVGGARVRVGTTSTSSLRKPKVPLSRTGISTSALIEDGSEALLQAGVTPVPLAIIGRPPTPSSAVALSLCVTINSPEMLVPASRTLVLPPLSSAVVLPQDASTPPAAPPIPSTLARIDAAVGNFLSVHKRARPTLKLDARVRIHSGPIEHHSSKSLSISMNESSGQLAEVATDDEEKMSIAPPPPPAETNVINTRKEHGNDDDDGHFIHQRSPPPPLRFGAVRDGGSSDDDESEDGKRPQDKNMKKDGEDDDSKANKPPSLTSKNKQSLQEGERSGGRGNIVASLLERKKAGSAGGGAKGSLFLKPHEHYDEAIQKVDEMKDSSKLIELSRLRRSDSSSATALFQSLSPTPTRSTETEKLSIFSMSPIIPPQRSDSATLVGDSRMVNLQHRTDWSTAAAQSPSRLASNKCIASSFSHSSVAASSGTRHPLPLFPKEEDQIVGMCMPEVDTRLLVIPAKLPPPKPIDYQRTLRGDTFTTPMHPKVKGVLGAVSLGGRCGTQTAILTAIPRKDPTTEERNKGKSKKGTRK